jgi:hypothetical protein
MEAGSTAFGALAHLRRVRQRDCQEAERQNDSQHVVSRLENTITWYDAP